LATKYQKKVYIVKNPCDICIVKACCTLFCKDKEFYTERLNTEVTQLRRHIYSVSDNKKKKIPRTIRLHWESKTKLQAMNLREINNILDRGTSGHEKSM